MSRVIDHGHPCTISTHNLLGDVDVHGKREAHEQYVLPIPLLLGWQALHQSRPQLASLTVHLHQQPPPWLPLLASPLLLLILSPAPGRPRRQLASAWRRLLHHPGRGLDGVEATAVDSAKRRAERESSHGRMALPYGDVPLPAVDRWDMGCGPSCVTAMKERISINNTTHKSNSRVENICRLSQLKNSKLDLNSNLSLNGLGSAAPLDRSDHHGRTRSRLSSVGFPPRSRATMSIFSRRGKSTYQQC